MQKVEKSWKLISTYLNGVGVTLVALQKVGQLVNGVSR
jgi:hypothetical protein